MLPHGAIEILENRKALRINYDTKCIDLYQNAIGSGKLSWMLPMWEKFGEARNQRELDAFIDPAIVAENQNLDEGIAWFWIDIGAIDEVTNPE
jgi:hypothetical protein